MSISPNEYQIRLNQDLRHILLISNKTLQQFRELIHKYYTTSANDEQNRETLNELVKIGDITGKSIERLEKFVRTLEIVNQKQEFILDREDTKSEARDILMKISHEMRIMNTMLGNSKDAHKTVINRTLQAFIPPTISGS